MLNLKTYFILLFTIFYVSQARGQYNYESSNEHPYGQLNPEAPEQLADYGKMIGICDCKSERRTQDGGWAAPVDMTWEFRYIMNGMAVQDLTLKADGVHSGSIRQYNTDSASWYVHYYSTAAATPQLASWSGGKQGDDIILYKEQKAPNGMDGFYKINFTNITNKGFNWLGEWVSTDESFKHQTWRISCLKRNPSDLN